MRLIALSTLVVLLAACSGPSPEQLAATAQGVIETGVVLTVAAAPTQTMPPSATYTATLEPTATPQATQAEVASATATTAVQPAGQGTQISDLPTAVSAQDVENSNDNRAPVLLQNNTEQTVWVVLDGPIYLEYRFSDTMLILLERGEYDYRVWIGDKGPLQGSFRIGNQDKHTLVFSANKVQFFGP
jgi:hypothetical protein